MTPEGMCTTRAALYDLMYQGKSYAADVDQLSGARSAAPACSLRG